MPPDEITLHLVPGCIRLQKRDAVKQSPNVTHTALEHVIRNVLKNIGADDEVVPLSEWQVREVGKRAQPDVSPAAESAHDVRARIHAEVADARTETPKLRAPRSLARSDVQDRSYIAAKEVLGDAQDHAHLAAHGVRCMNSGTRFAVPPGEVRFVVGLTLGASRQCGRSHAGIDRKRGETGACALDARRVDGAVGDARIGRGVQP